MLNFSKNEYEKLNSKYAGEKSDLEKYLDSIDKQGLACALDRFSDLIDSYKQFLETLTPDQTVALVNIFGYYMIFQTLISICFIIAGDIIIEKLNLESRYPRLSKFIKARAKFRKAYL
jgi:hypothetical protein